MPNSTYFNYTVAENDYQIDREGKAYLDFEELTSARYEFGAKKLYFVNEKFECFTHPDLTEESKVEDCWYYSDEVDGYFSAVELYWDEHFKKYLPSNLDAWERERFGVEPESNDSIPFQDVPPPTDEDDVGDVDQEPHLTVVTTPEFDPMSRVKKVEIGDPNNQLPPVNKLVYDGSGNVVVPANMIFALVGAEGEGKSMIALDLMLSTASQGEGRWLGELFVKPGIVLYLRAEDFEQHDHFFQRRMISWMRNRIPPYHWDEMRKTIEANFYQVDVRDTPLITRKGSVYEYGVLYTIIQAFVRTVNAHCLVVLDGIYRVTGSEESNEAMFRLISACEACLHDHVSFLLIHHKSKIARMNNVTNSSAARGGSAFSAGVRLQFDLSGGRTKKLAIAKSNHSMIAEWKMEYDNGVFNTLSTSRVQERKEQAKSEKDATRFAKAVQALVDYITARPGERFTATDLEELFGKDKPIDYPVAQRYKVINHAVDDTLIYKEKDGKSTVYLATF